MGRTSTAYHEAVLAQRHGLADRRQVLQANDQERRAPDAVTCHMCMNVAQVLDRDHGVWVNAQPVLLAVPPAIDLLGPEEVAACEARDDGRALGRCECAS